MRPPTGVARPAPARRGRTRGTRGLDPRQRLPDDAPRQRRVQSRRARPPRARSARRRSAVSTRAAASLASRRAAPPRRAGPPTRAPAPRRCRALRWAASSGTSRWRIQLRGIGASALLASSRNALMPRSPGTPAVRRAGRRAAAGRGAAPRAGCRRAPSRRPRAAGAAGTSRPGRRACAPSRAVGLQARGRRLEELVARAAGGHLDRRALGLRARADVGADALEAQVDATPPARGRTPRRRRCRRPAAVVDVGHARRS